MSSNGDVIRTFSATFTFPELLLFMILSLAVENKELRKLKGYNTVLERPCLFLECNLLFSWVKKKKIKNLDLYEKH